MFANPTGAALSTELAEAVDRTCDFAKASKAQATRKAYAVIGPQNYRFIPQRIHDCEPYVFDCLKYVYLPSFLYSIYS
jgi:hypothetical protein